MSTFEENLHPRRTDGRFAPKPGGASGEPDGLDLGAAMASAGADPAEPVTVTDIGSLRDALAAGTEHVRLDLPRAQPLDLVTGPPGNAGRYSGAGPEVATIRVPADTVIDVGGHTELVDISGVRLGVVDGDASIERLLCGASAERITGGARVGTIHGGPDPDDLRPAGKPAERTVDSSQPAGPDRSCRIGTIDGQAMVADIGGTTRIGRVGGEAFIGVARGSDDRSTGTDVVTIDHLTDSATIEQTAGVCSIGRMDGRAAITDTLGGRTSVGSMDIEATVVRVGDHATIGSLDGSCGVGSLAGHSSVSYVGGRARIGRMADHARVDQIDGRAQVNQVTDQARLSDVAGAAEIGRVSEHARVDRVRGRAKVEEVFGDATLGEIDHSARVGRVGGRARIETVAGGARVGVVKSGASIGTVTGTAQVAELTELAHVDVASENARIGISGPYATVGKIEDRAWVNWID